MSETIEVASNKGARKPGSTMTTSCLLGDMRSDKSMREEFLNF